MRSYRVAVDVTQALEEIARDRGISITAALEEAVRGAWARHVVERSSWTGALQLLARAEGVSLEEMAMRLTRAAKDFSDEAKNGTKGDDGGVAFGRSHLATMSDE
ncbi:MAG: hypothetical protein M3R38_03955 [Actinomycetota bacterium]|nr:hypothetical protein [Actinomycetota bacterium]